MSRSVRTPGCTNHSNGFRTSLALNTSEQVRTRTRVEIHADTWMPKPVQRVPNQSAFTYFGVTSYPDSCRDPCGHLDAQTGPTGSEPVCLYILRSNFVPGLVSRSVWTPGCPNRSNSCSSKADNQDLDCRITSALTWKETSDSFGLRDIQNPRLSFYNSSLFSLTRARITLGSPLLLRSEVGAGNLYQAWHIQQLFHWLRR